MTFNNFFSKYINLSLATYTSKILLASLMFFLLPCLQADKIYVASPDGKVVVIDRQTNKVETTIPLNKQHPYNITITPNGKKAYVPDYLEGQSVSVIDMATNKVIKKIVVGSLPFDVAITPNGEKAYVTNYGDNTVSVIDIATDKVIGDPITVVTGVPTSPTGIAINADGTKAYVANFTDFAGKIAVIDTTTDTKVKEIDIPSTVNDRIAIAVTSNGERAYVTDYGYDAEGQSVYVINTTTDAVIGGPITVGKGPRGIAITPNGKKAYVANSNSSNKSVSVINTTTNTLKTTINNIGSEPTDVAITPDGKKAYVSSEKQVFVIDTTTDKVDGDPIFVGDISVGLAILPAVNVSFTTTPSVGITITKFSFRANVQGGVEPYSYLWKFGDGQTSTAKSPTHFYSTIGNYTPTLVVTDKNGLKARKSGTVKVISEAAHLLEATSNSHIITQKRFFINRPRNL